MKKKWFLDLLERIHLYLRFNVDIVKATGLQPQAAPYKEIFNITGRYKTLNTWVQHPIDFSGM